MIDVPIIAACGAITGFLILVMAGFVARRGLRSGATAAVDPAATPLRGWLFDFARPYRVPILISLLLTLTSTGLALLAPWPFKVLVDSVLGDDPLPTVLSGLEGLPNEALIAVFVGATVGVLAASIIINYLLTYLLGAAEIRMATDMRTAVFRRMQEVSLRFHDGQRTGDLVSRLMADVKKVRDVMLSFINSILPQMLSLVGGLVIMLLIDAQMTLVALAVIPILLYYARSKRPQIRAAQREARDRRGELSSHATDALRNVRAIQAFAREDDETARFHSQLNRTADAAINSLDVQARYAPISSIVLGLGTAGVTWFGVRRIVAGELSLGTLLVFTAYLGHVYGPVRSLSRMVSTVAKGQASRDRIMELFAAEHMVVESPTATDAWSQPASLTVDNVSFGYDAETPVLQSFNFRLNEGEAACVVGVSGEGKSTLLSLLLRLYEPTSGSIRLGQRRITDLTLHSLRERIALVPQDPWIMDGTIRDNVVFGFPGATLQQFNDAADRALVSNFVEPLKDGYDTKVGESGDLLSGGQRRRIALARALIRDSSVLLMDEPTSGLDALSAASVLDAIDHARVGRTTLVVSHDLMVAQRLGRVIVIDNGQVVEDGQHDDLVRSEGPYQRLWESQTALRVVDLTEHHDADSAHADITSQENSNAIDLRTERARLLRRRETN